VQYDRAAADRFFGRITIIAGSIGIAFGLITLGVMLFGR